MSQTIKVLANGGPGSGKTWFGASFPLVGYVGTEPNGLDSVLGNPQAVFLRKNIVQKEEFLPSPEEDIKLSFERMEKFLNFLHKEGKEGRVRTLFVDNLTYLSLSRWLYIEKYEPKRNKEGELDTRGMYGALGLWLYSFVLKNIVSFPGNVVISCHEQRDDEQDLKKALNPLTPITPDVLGAMKYRIAGLLSASIYLYRKRGEKGGWEFWARCIEGEGKAAKNRYGLPEVVQGISYETIVKQMGNGESS